eukprot:708425_1
MMPVRRIYKQIIYFDVTRPNQYINDAEWWDATSIYPIPCHTSTYTIFVGHLPANRQPTDNHHIIHIRWAQSHPQVDLKYRHFIMKPALADSLWHLILVIM